MKKITAVLLVLVIVFFITSYDKFYNDTKKIDNGETLMIAHRGLSGLEIENTDRAFIAAGERSYFGIEADVRRTADGKLIICHDEDLKRIAWKNILVEETAYDELLSVKLRDRWWRETDATLTTLDSFISICKEYGKRAVLELKSSFTNEEIGEIIGVIDSLGYTANTTFISFDYVNLLYIRESLPECQVMYLSSELTDELEARLISDKIDLAIKHTELEKDDVQRLHDAGLKINCWTVDSKHRAMELVSWGVDYITSNIIE